MKRPLVLIGRSIAALVAILIPFQASAQTIRDTVTSVGRLLTAGVSTSVACNGRGCGFVQIVSAFVENTRPLVFIGAVFLITVAGFRMVITEEEESFGKAKRVISASITGVILSYLVGPFTNAFYGGFGTGIFGSIFGGIGIGSVPIANLGAGASVLSTEIAGFIHWALVILGFLTVFMIIVSGFKAMMKSGSEEGLEHLRKTVFYVIGGVLLILSAAAINRTLGLSGDGNAVLPGSPSIGPVAGAIVTILNFILGFMALIAVAVIVFAGFQMILNFGNEETFGKAKGLIIRVCIGLVVIGISWALINFVMSLVL